MARPNDWDTSTESPLDQAKRIIRRKQSRLDELCHPHIWEHFTRHMEGGEYREFVQSCRDDEFIVKMLREFVEKQKGN